MNERVEASPDLNKPRSVLLHILIEANLSSANNDRFFVESLLNERLFAQKTLLILKVLLRIDLFSGENNRPAGKNRNFKLSPSTLMAFQRHI